jgi:hypothetical protein
MCYQTMEDARLARRLERTLWSEEPKLSAFQTEYYAWIYFLQV